MIWSVTGAHTSLATQQCPSGWQLALLAWADVTESPCNFCVCSQFLCPGVAMRCNLQQTLPLGTLHGHCQPHLPQEHRKPLASELCPRSPGVPLLGTSQEMSEPAQQPGWETQSRPGQGGSTVFVGPQPPCWATQTTCSLLNTTNTRHRPKSLIKTRIDTKRHVTQS